MFEKVATESEWSMEKWPLLVQSVLTGKVQRAAVALDSRVGLVYDALRKAVLETYGNVPEAYSDIFHQENGRGPFRFCCLCCFESLGFSPFELISGHEVKGPIVSL